jgi:hypothetical protein
LRNRGVVPKSPVFCLKPSLFRIYSAELFHFKSKAAKLEHEKNQTTYPSSPFSFGLPKE